MQRFSDQKQSERRGRVDMSAGCEAPVLLSFTSFLSPRSYSAQEALATIGEKLCVELSQCLSQHGYSPFSADRKNTLRSQISATVHPDNTVRKLMGKSSDTYDRVVLRIWK